MSRTFLKQPIDVDWRATKLLLYLHSALHIRYNTGLSLASIGFTSRSKRIEYRWLFTGAGRIVDSATASSTFRAIATAITAAGGARPRARCFSATFARARRTWRFRLLRKRSRLSRTRSASRGRFPDSSWMRTPCSCRNWRKKTRSTRK